MKPIKIKRWIRDGHDGLESQGINNTDELLDSAGRLMDKSYTHDIIGEVLFEGEDGKYYCGCIEFHVSEAGKGYVEDVLAEEDDDS